MADMNSIKNIIIHLEETINIMKNRCSGNDDELNRLDYGVAVLKQWAGIKAQNEQSNCNIPQVSPSVLQLCPKCNGQGKVSKPPWVAGDIQTWISSASSFTCDLCNGSKVIQH